MTFVWHHALWLLLALPAIAGAYLLVLRRPASEALRYTAFRGLRSSPVTGLKAHLPALLMLAGLGVLLLGAARPVLVTTQPATQGTVVLLVDVSLSMAASDVAPTRLAAARTAARGFIDAQPPDVAIAVVAFGGHADVVQPPTANRKAVRAAIEKLELQRFTAIGNGLMAALLTLVPGADVPHGHDIFGMGRPPPGVQAIPWDPAQRARMPPRKTVRPGSYLSAAIILVSDGLGTIGVPARVAAKMAAAHGIRVYTVGVGTLYGGVANIEGWDPIHAEFDDATLIAIAEITGGEYFLARDADKVTTIYEKLGRRVVLERTEREITVLFTAVAVLLMLAAAALSLVRGAPGWA